MKLSKSGKSITMQINVWLVNGGATVGMGSNEAEESASGFIVNIAPDETKPNGHRNLYRELIKILQQNGITMEV